MPSHPPFTLASLSCASSLLPSIPYLLLLPLFAIAEPSPSVFERDPNNNPLNINWDPAPAPEDGPPISASALRDKSYLPAQIGAIVGAYAFSLVLVAITLLCLAKKRREHLKAANDEADFETEYIPDSKDSSAERFDPTIVAQPFTTYDHVPQIQHPGDPHGAVPYVPNFSYPSPTKTEFNEPTQYIHPSPISVSTAPGVNFQVDQGVVAADRAMAQQQLEEMYRHVMEHEDAKQRGTAIETPLPVPPPAERYSTSDRSMRSTISKKEKNKPANLNLSGANEAKTQSRTSSLFSALRSPKKKAAKGVNISSPIMTPQSGTFPRQESQEMSGIPPRHYAPPPPPPVPTIQPPVSASRTHGAPMTPDISPQSVQSIDERIAVQVEMSHHNNAHNRNVSQAPTEYDPESAVSMHSNAPLVGLPASPRSPGFKQSLPSSPKPGMSFSRPNPPSAVRTGGSLPLRAYEPSMISPSIQTTKQTVFERKGPLSPGSGRTPFTAGAAPYSPYQPNTPVVPMTPSLVTKEDRKRMKRMVPKTPTLQMVESQDDTW